MKHAFQEINVACPARSADLIDAPGGPGVHRGIDVGKGKFVSRNLTVRVHVPFAQKEFQLLLREGWVEMSEREHMKGKVPGSKPGILPFIWHRNHVPAIDL